jgi:hypothetical protein
MCTAIAIAATELPAVLLEDLGDRVYVRGGQKEIQFHWWKTPTLLPVRWEGTLRLCRWGCKERRSPLPIGGWISRDQVAAGILAEPEEGVIPANLGHDKGTWFVISEGIQAVIANLPGGPVVYMLTEPSSNYYRNMTEQSPMMPVFVNQVI